MKNILVLTSVYPAKDLPKDHTPVVHYFAREWIALGYNVMVVHNIQYYPRFVYFILNQFKKIISKHYNFIFQTERISKEKYYMREGVNVYRLPIYKRTPISLFSKKEQKKQLEKIIKLMDTISFKPDMIIAHWVNPQLKQLIELGEFYNSGKCLVVHSDAEFIRRIYRNKTTDIVRQIDIWGFRSNAIKTKFEILYGRMNKSFLCYSGIPSKNIKLPLRTFKNGVRNFIFVGLLISRKYPTVLIKAINKALIGKEFHITFIGDGPEKEKIQLLAKKMNIAEQVSLPGRMSREKVFKMMQQADCFIMVSKPETFGLVYLEAMRMGCITIGSKNEGIDGVIQHGHNGYLCNPGNSTALSKLIKKISKLSQKKLSEISNNAIEAAANLTDKKVAKSYIESVKTVASGLY